MVIRALYTLAALFHQRIVDGQKDRQRLVATSRCRQRPARPSIQHLPANLPFLLGVQFHLGHEAVQAAGAFAVGYRSTQSGQIAAAQVDEQTEDVRLKMPVLWPVAECVSEQIQEIAEGFVALYNCF
jgi:hypothetical protein